MAKPQRVRDPLHNLIEFGREKFDQTLWGVVRTRPFQRLRRIKQLGFSELVYPGATHTRFAHSLGVFHTARLLMQVIERHLGDDINHYMKGHAIAAALVHDLGHGPFSHAFEEVGKRFKWESADHEKMSVRLIVESDVSEALNEMGGGFAKSVAEVLQKTPNIYGSVVSSQFDADRLDYMQRDRLMTGSQHAAIDFKWLIENLEVDSVPIGEDDTQTGSLETFVLGQKAAQAAEGYVLGLFQLYPTVFYHKATRSAEAMFTELLARVFQLAIDGSFQCAGLPKAHPLIRFALNPENLENFIDLDDTVVWGAFSMMSGAKDRFVSDMSSRIRDRKLFKAIDVRKMAAAKAYENRLPDDAHRQFVDEVHAKTRVAIEEMHAGDPALRLRILIDEGDREPYKKFSESKGPLNQIRIKVEDGTHVDLVERSKVVKAIETFKFLRIYVAEEDGESRSRVDTIINEKMEEANDS